MNPEVEKSDMVSERLEIALKEFEALKREQLHRIGVRDHVIYLNIFAAVALIGVISKLGNGAPLLLVPWVGLLLGWTYLVNDEKVSAIGRYVRNNLSKKLESFIKEDGPDYFGWEIAHRSDKDRVTRKRLQLAIDMAAFVMPGVVALMIYVFVFLDRPIIFLFVLLEAMFLAILARKIYEYADLAEGK